VFKIIGKIKFDPVNVTKKHSKQAAWKRVVVVEFDGDTYAYYAWFIKNRYGIELNKPLRGTHITIVSDIVDNDIYEQARKVFDGKELTIEYDPTEVRTNGGHWWLKAYSVDAENIRRAIGLDPTPYFGFHLTLGVATHLQLDQSKYIHTLIKKGLV